MVRLNTFLLLGALGMGCPQQDLCTAQAVPGITVALTDAITHVAVCDATVKVQSGTYQETLQPFAGVGPDECTYQGAYERKGSYTITATRDAYRQATRDNVGVTVDNCHVITQKVDISLSPL